MHSERVYVPFSFRWAERLRRSPHPPPATYPHPIVERTRRPWSSNPSDAARSKTPPRCSTPVSCSFSPFLFFWHPAPAFHPCFPSLPCHPPMYHPRSLPPPQPPRPFTFDPRRERNRDDVRPSGADIGCTRPDARPGADHDHRLQLPLDRVADRGLPLDQVRGRPAVLTLGRHPLPPGPFPPFAAVMPLGLVWWGGHMMIDGRSFCVRH